MVRDPALKERVKKTFSWLWNSVLKSKSQWVEVHVSPQKGPEPTMHLHAHLRTHGISCKLHHLNSGGSYGFSNLGMVSLRVHKDDVENARQLMREVEN